MTPRSFFFVVAGSAQCFRHFRDEVAKQDPEQYAGLTVQRVSIVEEIEQGLQFARKTVHLGGFDGVATGHEQITVKGRITAPNAECLGVQGSEAARALRVATEKTEHGVDFTVTATADELSEMTFTFRTPILQAGAPADAGGTLFGTFFSSTARVGQLDWQVDVPEENLIRGSFPLNDAKSDKRWNFSLRDLKAGESTTACLALSRSLA